MSDKREELKPLEIFVQGVYLRIVYGLAGIGIATLIWPRMFAERNPGLFVGLSIYLCICILGGIIDTRRDSIRDQKVYVKITEKTAIRAILYLVVAIVLFWSFNEVYTPDQ